MVNPDSYTDNDGIREIDVTIYDDYPIYLMENAWTLDDVADIQSAKSAQKPGQPAGNRFNSNEYFRADTFNPADPSSAPRPN